MPSSSVCYARVGTMTRADCLRRGFAAWFVLLRVSTRAQDVPCQLANWTYDVTATGEPVIGDDGTLFVSSGANLYSLAADGTLNWKYDLPNGQDADPPALDSTGTIYVQGGEILYAITERATLKWQFNMSSLPRGRWKWVEGSGGQSCDEACKAADATCAGGTPAVYSSDIQAIASELGVRCETQSVTSSRTTAPYLDASSKEGCSGSSSCTCVPQYYTSTQQTTDCSTGMGVAYYRFCPCTRYTDYQQAWRDIHVYLDRDAIPAVMYLADLSDLPNQRVYTLTTSGTIGSNSSIPQDWCQGKCYALGSHEAMFYIFGYQSSSTTIGTVYAMTFAGGTAVQQWSVNIPGLDAHHSVPNRANVTADGALYVDFKNDEGRDVFYAISALGEVLWVSNKGSQCTMASANVTYCSDGDTLYMMDARLGIIHWTYETEDVITLPAIGSDDTIYVGSRDWKLYALLPTGELKWILPMRDAVTGVATGSTASSVIGNDEVIYVTLPDRVVGVRPSCGVYRCVENQCVPFAPGSPGFSSSTACEAACGTTNHTAYYCIYNRCVLGRSFQQKGFPTNTSCNNACGPYDACRATLQHVCGAAKAVSTASCYICCGTHQPELQAAHCDQTDFSNFCEK